MVRAITGGNRACMSPCRSDYIFIQLQFVKTGAGVWHVVSEGSRALRWGGKQIKAACLECSEYTGQNLTDDNDGE